MKSKYLLLAAVVLSLAVTSAQAEIMVLTGQDLRAQQGNAMPTMTLGVENPTQAADYMISWSLTLKIVPDATATGTVEFTGAAVAADNYIFQGESGGLFLFGPFPGLVVDTAADNHSNLTPFGITVPVEGFNLLDLSFQASADAAGTFYVQSTDWSYWGTYDDLDDDQFMDGNEIPTDFQFANVPIGDNVTIGSIIVDVPEPGTITLLLTGGLGLVFFGWRRSKRQR